MDATRPRGYIDGLNLQEFVRSNPLRYRDPSGLAITFDGFNKDLLNPPNHLPTANFRAALDAYKAGNQNKRDYIQDHQWGGTQARNARWDEAKAARDQQAEEIGCREWIVLRTYEGMGTISSRADSLLVADGAPIEIKRLATQFAALAQSHEQKHVDNYLATHADISATGRGTTKAEAEADAEESYNRQKGERMTRFRTTLTRINGDGDRQTGMKLLRDILAASERQ